jgi:hypothetical protein
VIFFTIMFLCGANVLLAPIIALHKQTKAQMDPLYNFCFIISTRPMLQLSQVWMAVKGESVFVTSFKCGRIYGPDKYGKRQV